jgi:hypothetical protein
MRFHQVINSDKVFGTHSDFAVPRKKIDIQKGTLRRIQLRSSYRDVISPMTSFEVIGMLDLPAASRALVESISQRTLAAPSPSAEALGLLSSPLVVLSKHLKPIRDHLVGHASGNAKQGPRRIQIFLAQHDQLRDQSSRTVARDLTARSFSILGRH